MTPALVAEVETKLYISQVDNEVKLNKKKNKKVANNEGGNLIQEEIKNKESANERATNVEEKKEDSKPADTPLADGEGKKKKKKKKKAAPSTSASIATGSLKQTNPPSIPVSQLFPNRDFPTGEIQYYLNENSYRTTSEEMRAMERLNETLYEDVRLAAEVHRQTRAHINNFIKPGMLLVDIAEEIERVVRTIGDNKGLHQGIGFPTGLSLNHVAAHYTPSTNDKTVLQYDDVMKVDFGVHVNGRIIDSAYTWAPNPRYDLLKEAVREATNAGVKTAGIDARMGDIGAAIQEVMESYEVTINNQTFPVLPLRNLSGHSIIPFHIHGSKSVPIIKCESNVKMEEGEFFAIETFGSIGGKGYVVDGGSMEEGIYEKNDEVGRVPIRLARAKTLLSSINKHFDTLPFSRRYLDRVGETKYLMGMKTLVEAGLVSAHMPLMDMKGSFTAQFEHTFILRPTCKEVLSRGDDY